MSSNSSGGLIQEFGGSFFHWVSVEVLPYILGSVLGICVLVGIILNIILLVVYGKRQLYKDPTNDFIPQIAIVDLLASFIVVIPSSVAALLHEWPFPDTLCLMHGVLVTWFHLLSFALVILIFVERVVKAWNPNLHGNTFNTHTFVVIISVFTWAGDFLVAFLPILGIGSIAFNKYQSQCSLEHDKHHISTHVIFGLGLYISPLVVIICFAMLIEKRRRNIVHERNEERNKLIDLNESGEEKPEKWAESPTNLSGGDKGGKGTGSDAPKVIKNGPSKAWDKTSDKGKNQLFKKNPNNPAAAGGKGEGPCAKKTSREEFLESYNKRMSRPTSTTLVSRMFRDTEEEKDHHQAMTALITWGVLEICWVWYLVAAMLVMYSGTDVWGGWHVIGVLMGDLTYCIKPIVYLAHNRHYRKASKETMPDAVREKADIITQKMSQAVEKMDNVLFHSPGAQKSKTQKLQAAIATQKAAMIWKRKAIGKFGFGKKIADAGKTDASKAASDSATRPKPAASLSGSVVAAAALAQAEAAKKDPATRTKSPEQKLPPVPELLIPPGSAMSSLPSTRQGTAGTLNSSRPATKSSVLLSVGGSAGPASPNSLRPPSTARSSIPSGDDDLAQLMNPHSPHV